MNGDGHHPRIQREGKRTGGGKVKSKSRILNFENILKQTVPIVKEVNLRNQMADSSIAYAAGVSSTRRYI